MTTTYSDRLRSPDVAERETLDNGFSKGWGFHFQPNEDYWLDCHSHMGSPTTHAEFYRILADWFAQLDAFRLGRVIAIVTKPEVFQVCRDLAAQDTRFGWLFRIPHDQPDVALVQRAFEHGALGLKLHNSPLMQGKAGHDVWLTKPWTEIFEMVNRAKKVLLWHITQRVSVSPYHGGGESLLARRRQWRDHFNEDLLQTALQVARAHPELTLIGAHQIHVGLERLDSIFREHPTWLWTPVVPVSCVGATIFIRKTAKFCGHFSRKHQDRMLFGTDSSLALGTADAYQTQTFLCHARFIHQLRLPDAVYCRR